MTHGTRCLVSLSLTLLLSLPASAAERPWPDYNDREASLVAGCFWMAILLGVGGLIVILNRPQDSASPPQTIIPAPPPHPPVAGAPAGEIGLQALQAALDGDHDGFLARLSAGSPLHEAYGARARFDALSARLQQMEIVFPFGKSERQDQMQLMVKTGQSPNEWIRLATMQFAVENGEWRLHSIHWN